MELSMSIILCNINTRYGWLISVSESYREFLKRLCKVWMGTVFLTTLENVCVYWYHGRDVPRLYAKFEFPPPPLDEPRKWCLYSYNDWKWCFKALCKVWGGATFLAGLENGCRSPSNERKWCPEGNGKVLRSQPFWLDDPPAGRLVMSKRLWQPDNLSDGYTRADIDVRGEVGGEGVQFLRNRKLRMKCSVWRMLSNARSYRSSSCDRG